MSISCVQVNLIFRRFLLLALFFLSISTPLFSEDQEKQSKKSPVLEEESMTVIPPLFPLPPRGQSVVNPSKFDFEICGDGLLQISLNEQCDDGNAVNGDGCSATCQKEIGTPVCGDGILDAQEECDDGNTAAEDGCSASCKTEKEGDGQFVECAQGFTCSVQTSATGLCSSTSLSCDGEPVTEGTCGTSACSGECRKCPPQAVPACGDGKIDQGEACDDGNTFSGDGCSQQCKVEAVSTCQVKTNCNQGCSTAGGLEVADSCGPNDDQWVAEGSQCQCPAGKCVKVACFTV